MKENNLWFPVAVSLTWHWKSINLVHKTTSQQVNPKSIGKTGISVNQVYSRSSLVLLSGHQDCLLVAMAKVEFPS